MANATLNREISHSMAAALQPFRHRAARLTVTRIVILGLVALFVALLAAMWLDLVWTMPKSARWAITRIGGAAGLMMTAASCWWFVRRLTPQHIALWIDSRARTGGETVAGWQLERHPPSRGTDLSRGFASLAAARAGERVRLISPERILPADPVRKSAWILCGAVLLTGCLAILMPTLAWNQWQRFMFPERDVPPYTGVTIELNPAEASALYGSDLTINANVTRGRTEFMELVSVAADGRERTLPMLAQRPDQWQAVLTRVTEPLDFYARSGRSRSRVGHLNVQMTPQILATKLRITPPAYTRRPAFEGAIPKDGITGLAGTQVEFTVTSNRPLRDGQLRLAFRDGSNEQVSLAPLHTDESATVVRGFPDGVVRGSPDPAPPAVVRGSMQLTKSGSFDLSVFDVDGLESLDHVGGAINITVDQRPVVRILEPKPLSLATPDVRLPVVIAAEDDFGITRLQLFRSLNGTAATAMNCEVNGGDPRQHAVVDLPLEKYGLSPGDEIRLFARAEDNDPAGAKGAESPVTVVRIISTEQFQQMMLQEEGAQSLMAKYQAAERYLEKLADALREAQEAADKAAANPESKDAANELQQKLSAAQKAASEAAENIQKLSEQPMPIDVDRELAQRLAKMAEDAKNAAGELGKTLDAQAGTRALTADEKDALKKLAEKTAGQRGQLEKQAIEPLERLQQAMPLIIDQQRFSELALQQRDLAQRLESLRNSPNADDPATQRRVSELEAEQQRLRETLDNLLDYIAAHADALPDVPELQKLKSTATKFVEDVRKSEAQPTMSDAQQKLLGSDFSGAVGQATRAAEILESFLSKCNSMGNSACKSCELKFNPSAGCPPLGNSIQQMLAMMGMKPGMGGKPGMGFGFGAGGGYSMRMPGPKNVGMYGSLPMPTNRPSRGHGDRTSQGVSTNSGATPQRSGNADVNNSGAGSPSGQAASNVPPQYRSQVAEYFKRLAEQLGEQQ